MDSWLALVTQCENVQATFAKGYSPWAELAHVEAKVAVLETDRNGNAKWLLPEPSRARFLAQEPESHPGQFTRVAALLSRELPSTLLKNLQNPWPLRNPKALFREAYPKAKRMLLTNEHIGVLARDGRILLLARQEAILSIAKAAFVEATFDKHHRDALSNMPES